MEKWKIKNALAYMTSYIPNGDRLYYQIQKNITKSVWVDDISFKSYFESKVLKHLSEFKKFDGKSLNESKVFEFGAGWDLLAPIGFCLVGGVRHYVTVDLNAYVHPELIKNTLELYSRNAPFVKALCKNRLGLDVSQRLDALCSIIEDINISRINDYVQSIGIDYRTCYDASKTEFERSFFDYIVSNVTVEHIPTQSLKKILAECNRILNKEGIISITADLQAHYSYYDKSISVYNFLKYSGKEWRKYNPPRHYQNRLRKVDYEKLLNNAGFIIVDDIYDNPSEEDRKLLRTLPISKDFDKYNDTDLLIKGIYFVAKK